MEFCLHWCSTLSSVLFMSVLCLHCLHTPGFIYTSEHISDSGLWQDWISVPIYGFFSEIPYVSALLTSVFFFSISSLVLCLHNLFI